MRRHDRIRSFAGMIAVVLISAMGPHAAAQETLRTIPITAEDYPPYEMAEPVNGLRGFDYEVVSEAFARMGYSAEIEFLPWSRALLKVQLGQTSAALTCAYVPEREIYILYSDPISEFTSGFFVRWEYDGPAPTTLEDLRGQRTASVDSYESLGALRKAGLDPISAPNPASAVRMLMAKRFDYLYLSRESTEFVLRDLGLSGRVRFHPIDRQSFHLCFSRAYAGSETLAQDFNATLAAMRADGTYDAIHAKYR
ncbi:substrate-binding periplasmic protein [Pacificispira sp.]|uniref:substrate-binding periplasmic protein n=1 Tax=Pacificispira sp. TaxID=2888761 RepID=UPI003B522333